MVWNFHHHIFDEMDAPGWHHLLEAAYTMAKEGTVATFRSIHDDNTTAYA
jgi:hypothetical protein